MDKKLKLVAFFSRGADEARRIQDTLGLKGTSCT